MGWVAFIVALFLWGAAAQILHVVFTGRVMERHDMDAGTTEVWYSFVLPIALLIFAVVLMVLVSIALATLGDKFSDWRSSRRIKREIDEEVEREKEAREQSERRHAAAHKEWLESIKICPGCEGKNSRFIKERIFHFTDGEGYPATNLIKTRRCENCGYQWEIEDWRS